MRCEGILELLPDHALGTLSELEVAEVRRHLRGCGACRADALALDRGVAMFASAAHALEPPPELRDRVMTVLQDEWAEERPAAPRRPRRLVRWLAVAAVVAALGGSFAWGAVQRADANRSQTALAGFREDANSYRAFLHALGGREVRVARFASTGEMPVDVTAVLYDSDRGQSWALVQVKAPGYPQRLRAQLVSASGRKITFPFPIELAPNGDGDAWLVTSTNIISFRTVQLVAPDGSVVASGTAR